MHYDRHYEGTREERDAQALKDIREYCAADTWDTLQRWVGQVAGGTLSIEQLNIGFSFIGISGLPFHAFCRKYCLTQYRAWMHEGDDARKTDEAGFPLDLEAK